MTQRARSALTLDDTMYGRSIASTQILAATLTQRCAKIAGIKARLMLSNSSDIFAQAFSQQTKATKLLLPISSPVSSAMPAVKVYGMAISTCTRRVLATLEEKGIEYELITVDLTKGEQKTPEFLAMQVRGQHASRQRDRGLWSCIHQLAAVLLTCSLCPFRWLAAAFITYLCLDATDV